MTNSKISYRKPFIRVYEVYVLDFLSLVCSSLGVWWLLLDPNSFRDLLGQTGQTVIKGSKTWKGHKKEKYVGSVVWSDSYPLHSNLVLNWVLAPAKTAFPLPLLNTRRLGQQGRDRAFISGEFEKITLLLFLLSWAAWLVAVLGFSRVTVQHLQAFRRNWM